MIVAMAMFILVELGCEPSPEGEHKRCGMDAGLTTDPIRGLSCP
jgi:hypothetical protein